MYRCAALLAILLGIVLMAGHPTTAMSPHPRISVTYQPPLISIEASGATVAEVMREVARKVGFSIVETGSSDARLSFSIHDTPLPEALQRLLQSENHVLRYLKGTQTIDTVLLLGARGAKPSIPVNRRDEAFSRPGTQDESPKNPSAGIAPMPTAPVSDARPSTQADPADYKRRAEGSPQVADATDLLLRQAASSGPASQPTSASGGGSVSSATSTDVKAADPGSTLAITTRFAQRNVTKLVEALSAATSSMLSAQRR